jgi:hypothetical protein
MSVRLNRRTWRRLDGKPSWPQRQAGRRELVAIGEGGLDPSPPKIANQSYAGRRMHDGRRSLRQRGRHRREALTASEDHVIGSIANMHDRSPAAVLLAWHLQRGVSTVAKSVTPARLRANFAAADLVLTEAEMERTAALHRGYPHDLRRHLGRRRWPLDTADDLGRLSIATRAPRYEYGPETHRFRALQRLSADPATGRTTGEVGRSGVRRVSGVPPESASRRSNVSGGFGRACILSRKYWQPHPVTLEGLPETASTRESAAGDLRSGCDDIREVIALGLKRGEFDLDPPQFRP